MRAENFVDRVKVWWASYLFQGTPSFILWCTDAAKWAPHPHPTQQHVSDAAAHASVLHLIFFFFFLRIRADSAPIRANSASIRTDSGRFPPIRPKSSRIGWIRSYRPAAKTDQNRPKSALNHAGTAKIGFEWGPNILNLSFLNFILNICYFFCIFFFVLCFLPSSFFVLWTKDI